MPYVCWILLLFPLWGQAQIPDSSAWASEKMMAIQKAEENQRLNRLSYPEHLIESQIWQPPGTGTDSEPSASIPLAIYGLGILFCILLITFLVRVHIRNRQRVQREKLIWDKFAHLKSQFQIAHEANLWNAIGKKILQELSGEVLQKTTIQKLASSSSHKLQLAFALEDGQESTALSTALSQVLSLQTGSSLQVERSDKGYLTYLLSLPLEASDGLSEVPEADDLSVQPIGTPIKGIDQDFLSRANQIVTKKMGDADFNAEAFREEVGMSKTHFYRKLQELTQQSPGRYIRNMRLAKARELLEAGTGNVSEIAYEVGFNNLSYFSRCFRNEFGMLPSEVN